MLNLNEYKNVFSDKAINPTFSIYTFSISNELS